MYTTLSIIPHFRVCKLPSSIFCSTYGTGTFSRSRRSELVLMYEKYACSSDLERDYFKICKYSFGMKLP